MNSESVYESLNKPAHILVAISPTGSCRCSLPPHCLQQIAAQRIAQVAAQEQPVTSRERKQETLFPKETSKLAKVNILNSYNKAAGQICHP